MKAHPVKPRGRDIHEAHRVATPLELLFDLFFVVAIASASSQLHHGLMAGHTPEASLRFGLAFFAIWWAWINYTWFASAYDNDDSWFRILTMIQMTGVAILAVGIPGIFEGKLATTVVGYAVMRFALVIQWLRAARGDPGRRQACLRYAIGIAVVQVGWIARLWVPPALMWPTVITLVLAELAVPMWAESAAHTPWHAHHIAERFSLFTIIALGECVLGATNAVAGVLSAQGWSLDVALVGLGSVALVLTLWWTYFLLPSADALHHHRERAFGWGYGHFFIFASVAAMGSGLEVVADVLKAGQAASAHASLSLNVIPSVHAATSAAGDVATVGAAAHVGVAPWQAIAIVASAEAIYLIAGWVVYFYATRAPLAQGRLLIVNLACIAAVVLASALGLPLAWAVPLLAVGPLINIVYFERMQRLRQGADAPRPSAA